MYNFYSEGCYGNRIDGVFKENYPSIQNFSQFIAGTFHRHWYPGPCLTISQRRGHCRTHIRNRVTTYLAKEWAVQRWEHKNLEENTYFCEGLLTGDTRTQETSCPIMLELPWTTRTLELGAWTVWDGNEGQGYGETQLSACFWENSNKTEKLTTVPDKQ